MTEPTNENETKPLPGTDGAPIPYAKAVRLEAKLRRKIARAHDTYDKPKIYAFTDQYLKSYSARVVATVEANRGLKRHRRVLKWRLPESRRDAGACDRPAPREAPTTHPGRGADKVDHVKLQEFWSKLQAGNPGAFC